MSMRSLPENPYLRELKLEEEFKLQTPPNIELFQYFITFKTEVGIYRCAGDWFCRVGDYGGIFLEDLNATTDVVGSLSFPNLKFLKHILCANYTHIHKGIAKILFPSILISLNISLNSPW